MKDRFNYKGLAATTMLAITLAACGGADSSSPKVDFSTPAASRMGPGERWPGSSNTIIIGASVNCEKDSSPKREEHFLFPNQEANIKGFIIKASNPGEITDFRGNAGIDNIDQRPGRIILDLSLATSKAQIVAEKVTPSNAPAGTFIVASFKCNNATVEPKN